LINGEAGASYWDHIKTNSDLFINGFSPYDDDDDFKLIKSPEVGEEPEVVIFFKHF
jgi:hypothetical protein